VNLRCDRHQPGTNHMFRKGTQKSKHSCRLGQEILALCLGSSVRSVELPLPCFADRLGIRGSVVLEMCVRVLRCVKFKSTRLVHPTMCVRCFLSPQLSVHESCLWKGAERRIRMRRIRTIRGMCIAHQLHFCGIARPACSQALGPLTAACKYVTLWLKIVMTRQC
jgi:hypothetical protein